MIPLEPETRQVGKRWISQLSPQLDLLLKKGGIIVIPCSSDRVVIWEEGLNDHTTGILSSPRPSGYLGEELKRPFTAPEVRKTQRKIRTYHPHEGNIREIIPLGDHLGSHEHIDFSAAELPQKLKGVTLFPEAVPVHPGSPQTRVQFLEFRLQPLCTKAIGSEALPAARRATRLRWRVKAAVVARETILSEMVGERDLAVGAAYRLAAGSAQVHAMKASAVEKENGLLA